MSVFEMFSSVPLAWWTFCMTLMVHFASLPRPSYRFWKRTNGCDLVILYFSSSSVSTVPIVFTSYNRMSRCAWRFATSRKHDQWQPIILYMKKSRKTDHSDWGHIYCNILDNIEYWLIILFYISFLCSISDHNIVDTKHVLACTRILSQNIWLKILAAI